MRTTRLYLLITIHLLVCIAASEADERSKAYERMMGDLGAYLASGGQLKRAETEPIRSELKWATRRLNLELALARQAGIPVEVQQFQRPSPPAAEDAAPDYVVMAQLLYKQPMPNSEAQTISDAGPLTTDERTLQIVKKCLSERKEAMLALRRATAKPKCGFRRDWALGPEIAFPEYPKVREAARLLKAETAMLVKQKSYGSAVGNLARGLRMADHLASEPTIISYLIGIAIEAISLRGLSDLLQATGNDASVVTMVRRAILDHRPHYDLTRTIKSEAFMIVGLREMMRPVRTFEDVEFLTRKNPDEEKATTPLPPRDRRLPPQKRAAYPEETKTLQQMYDHLEARGLAALRELMQIADKSAIERRRLLEHYQGPDNKDNPLRHWTEIIIPETIRIAWIELTIRAKELELLAACSVLDYQARLHRIPETLRTVSQIPPLDPYTDKPLLYRTEPGGFVIYSVGPTGMFAGGKRGMKRAGKESYFRYPRD